MDNSTGQAHPQAPFFHYSPRPGAHSGYPNLQNGTFSYSPLPSAPTLQQNHQITSNMPPPQSSVPGYSPGHHRPSHRTPTPCQWPSNMLPPQSSIPGYSPGHQLPVHQRPSHRTPMPYQWPSNRLPPQSSPPGYSPGHQRPSHRTPMPYQWHSHGRYGVPVQQAHGVNGTAGPQMYNYFVNSNDFPQNVQINTAAGAHPGLHLNVLPLCPPRPGQSTSQSMPSTANLSPPNSNSARQVPQPQPQTRYDLPQLASMPPPNDSTPSRPAASDGSAAQGGNVHHNANVPVPSTTLPATASSRKRPASESPPQQPAKRQRPAANRSARQPPQPVAQANQVIPDQEHSSPVDDESDPELARLMKLIEEDVKGLPEPEHLPEDEISKIATRLVIEPDPSKPPPKGRTVFTWAEAFAEIMKILNGAEHGHVLRKRDELEQLADTVEKFIARPGRRPLRQQEREELVTIRYGRIIEDYIALCNLYHVRDYDTATTQKKHIVVSKIWEGKEQKRREQGPTLQEAQRDIFKWLQ